MRVESRDQSADSLLGAAENGRHGKVVIGSPTHALPQTNGDPAHYAVDVSNENEPLTDHSGKDSEHAPKVKMSPFIGRRLMPCISDMSM